MDYRMVYIGIIGYKLGLYRNNGLEQKMEATIMGYIGFRVLRHFFPILRIIVFWGLYRGPSWGNYHIPCPITPPSLTRTSKLASGFWCVCVCADKEI